MKVTDHDESFVIILSKHELNQAIKAQFPILAQFDLDDIDVTQGDSDNYARAFYRREIIDNRIPIDRPNSNGKH